MITLGTASLVGPCVRRAPNGETWAITLTTVLRSNAWDHERREPIERTTVVQCFAASRQVSKRFVLAGIRAGDLLACSGRIVVWGTDQLGVEVDHFGVVVPRDKIEQQTEMEIER